MVHDYCIAKCKKISTFGGPLMDLLYINHIQNICVNSNPTVQFIIPLIFIFLSCLEKAHDNKEFSRQNSKPRRES